MSATHGRDVEEKVVYTDQGPGSRILLLKSFTQLGEAKVCVLKIRSVNVLFHASTIVEHERNDVEGRQHHHHSGPLTMLVDCLGEAPSSEPALGPRSGPRSGRF